MRYKAETGTTQAFTADSSSSGCRLDVFLAGVLPECSRSFLKQLLDDHLVTVEPCRGTAKASYKLDGGEQITIAIPELVEMSADPEAIPLDILYEDQHLIVINKQPNFVVHPSPGHETGTLVNALLHHCADLSGIGGVLRPGIVHRLDRDTSGCLVAAKSDTAHQALAEQFALRTTEKTYLAITDGVPRPPTGKVEGQIGRHPKNRQLHSMLKNGGRHSLTLYKTLENYGTAALVECDIKTGRTHQIRVHLKYQHAPVLCDYEYGRQKRCTMAELELALAALGRGPRAGKKIIRQQACFPYSKEESPVLLRRQALHAWKLAFDHPVGGKRLEIEAPLPDDMKAVLDVFRG